MFACEDRRGAGVTSRLLKIFRLHAAQKDLRGEARDKSIFRLRS
jgi:hypothetical protein